ncbi:MAG: LamG domain-containing protein [Deltaproteobacteria bacterium]|nr:LamG domain-containing protein [Deltaproteobacteria bacterium]
MSRPSFLRNVFLMLTALLPLTIGVGATAHAETNLTFNPYSVTPIGPASTGAGTTVHSDMVNDITVWAFDSVTGRALPNIRIRIWTDRGVFVNGEGQTINVRTGSAGTATAGWIIGNETGRVTFFARLRGDAPGTYRKSVTAMIEPPVIREEQEIDDPSHYSAKHGELCDLGLNFDFLNAVCDLGLEKREYRVNSSASPSLLYMQVGDQRDFKFKLRIKNFECTSCEGCSWTGSGLHNCAACYAAKQNCEGWVPYESLRFTGYVMMYLMVPKNDQGEPVITPLIISDVTNGIKLKADPVAMPVPLVGEIMLLSEIFAPGAADALYLAFTSFQDTIDPKQYDLPMVNLTNPGSPTEITLFALWHLYVIHNILEILKIDISFTTPKDIKNIGEDIDTLIYPGRGLTAQLERINLVVEIVKNAIDVLGNLAVYFGQLGLTALAVGKPHAGRLPAGFPVGWGDPTLHVPDETDEYVIYPLGTILWPAPYEALELTVPVVATAPTGEIGRIVPIPAYVYTVQERRINAFVTETSYLTCTGSPHNLRVAVFDPLPKCKLGDTRCVGESRLEQCSWGTVLEYGDNDYKWYVWEPVRTPPDHICKDGEFVPECSEGQTRCTRKGDGFESFISHCEYSATDEYEIEHWHWVDYRVPVNQACKDGDLVPIELPDCPNNLVLYSQVKKGIGQISDWCPLHKASDITCDDRGNLYMCINEKLHCMSTYAKAMYLGTAPPDPTKCLADPEASCDPPCSEGDVCKRKCRDKDFTNWENCQDIVSECVECVPQCNGLEIICNPPCGDGETCKADEDGKSHCEAYCRPICITPHSNWPNPPAWGGSRRMGRWNHCGPDGCGGTCGPGCSDGVSCVDGACATCLDRSIGRPRCGDPAIGSETNPDLGVCSCADGCGFNGLPCCPDLCDYCPNTFIRFNPDYGLQDFNICACTPHEDCRDQDQFGLKCGATSDGCGGRCTCPEQYTCDYIAQAANAHLDPWHCRCHPSGINRDFYNASGIPWHWQKYKWRECDWGCGHTMPCPGNDEPCLTIEREWNGKTLRAKGVCAGTVACEDQSMPYWSKQCGPNGYGGYCGQFKGGCQFGFACDADGRCVCAPRCEGRTGNKYECGPDGCGGSCGECPTQHECRFDDHDQAYKCVCVPDCNGKECGDDGCGGSCGTCDPSFENTECLQGQCVCQPDCDGKDCGDDKCGGSCGDCTDGQACSTSQVCEVFETGCRATGSAGCNGCACESEVCATDPTCCSEAWDDYCVSLCRNSTTGCDSSYCANGTGLCDFTAGEDCASCPEDCKCPDGQSCTVQGSCCTPDCNGKDCGPDGCGGTCGTCLTGKVCDGGICAASDTCAGYCPADSHDLFKTGPGGSCMCGSACTTLDNCCTGTCECGANALLDLRFDESSITNGSPVIDSSRQDRTATLTASDSSEHSLADGKFERALHLAAIDHIEVSDPLLDPNAADTPLSFNAWIRATSGGGTVIGQDQGVSSPDRFGLRLLPDGRLSYDKGGVALASTASSLTDGTWRHVGFVRTASGNVLLYVDGARDGTSGTDTSKYEDTSTVIGQDMEADLDDLAVFEGALEDADMAALAQNRAHIYYGPVSFCDPECVPDCSSYGYDPFQGYLTGPDGCGGWCPCPGISQPKQVGQNIWFCAVDSCTDACDLQGVIRSDTNCRCDSECAQAGEQGSNCCMDLCDQCPGSIICPIVDDCTGKECGTVLQPFEPAMFCGESGGGCTDSQKVCMPDGTCCLPDCTGNECGDDGCGGSCGTCTGAQEQCQDGSCVCVPDCTGKECGDDGCGGSCGTCTGAQEQCQDGSCVCVPDCTGKECGDNGCDGTCGACGPGFACNDSTGTCECLPDCGGKECGGDGCGGSCGTCTGAQEQCLDGSCECIPDCTGKQCGDDGCGGSCGQCSGGQDVCESGACVCKPNCLGDVECDGDDGCGGTCGTCPAGQVCVSQKCMPSAPSDGITISGTPGCNGCACEECVCNKDPECCATVWSERCVSLCLESCGGNGTAECGNNYCETNADEDCATCPDDCGCAAGETCYQGKCSVCSCEGRECGDNGCGTSCGTCADANDQCVSGKCECIPDCNGKECGDDGCGGSCGTCAGGEGLVCHDGTCMPPTCEGLCGGRSDGDCWCDPGCLDKRDCCPDMCEFCGDQVPACPKDCGDSICDKDAGENCINCFVDCPCGDGEKCGAEGECCAPDCSGKECGNDGCGGSCGTCKGDDAECINGICECEPDCEGKECGDDGCGNSCGACGSDLTCSRAGLCAEPGSCLGSCGGQAPSGCMCDDKCMERGDCCPDRCDHCQDLVTCSTCGNGNCDKDKGENCDNCAADCSCATGEKCYNGMCCIPGCKGRECGDDGCGGSCGECGQGSICDAFEGKCTSGLGCAPSDEPGCLGCKCEPCVCSQRPECCTVSWDQQCVQLCGAFCGGCGGLDGCGDGTCSQDQGETCSNCPADCGCNQGQECTPLAGCCTPKCEGKDCGPDGCGGVCGKCEQGLCISGRCRSGPGCSVSSSPGCDGCACEECVCSQIPECCTDSWGEGCVAICNLSCGGCGAIESCGDGACQPEKLETCSSCPSDCTCAPGQVCTSDSGCCTPDCTGKECGDDGCGGSCGKCNGLCLDGACHVGAGCTSSQDSPGCGGCACGPCVQFLEPGCMDSAWDSGCAALCATRCGGCGDLPGCGDGKCSPEDRETCANCAKDCSCEDGETCAWFGCCTPDCKGRECGDDGCGGSCGECDIGSTCFMGSCRKGPGCDITRDETGPEPGTGCGGCACEECVCAMAPECCNIAWSEQCKFMCLAYCGGCGTLPGCGNGVCDDDGLENCTNCPQDCACDTGQVCSPFGCISDWCSSGVTEQGCCDGTRLLTCMDGTAVWTDCAWSGEVCGWTAFGDTSSEGSYSCGILTEVSLSGEPSGSLPLSCSDYCVPDCKGKECGDDGCGGSCGECGPADACHLAGTCNQGTCTQGAEVHCETDRTCRVARCDSNAGGCVEEPAPDGSACSTGQGDIGRCLSGECVSLDVGDACTNPLRLELGQKVTIDLSHMWDDASPGGTCNGPSSTGPDAFLVFNAEAGGDYTVEARALSQPLDVLLWTLDACHGHCSMLADQQGLMTTLDLEGTEPGDVLVVLDTKTIAADGKVEVVVTRKAQVKLVDTGGGCSTTGQDRYASILILLLVGLIAWIRSSKSKHGDQLQHGSNPENTGA